MDVHSCYTDYLNSLNNLSVEIKKKGVFGETSFNITLKDYAEYNNAKIKSNSENSKSILFFKKLSLFVNKGCWLSSADFNDLKTKINSNEFKSIKDDTDNIINKNETIDTSSEGKELISLAQKVRKLFPESPVQSQTATTTSQIPEETEADKPQLNIQQQPQLQELNFSETKIKEIRISPSSKQEKSSASNPKLQEKIDVYKKNLTNVTIFDILTSPLNFANYNNLFMGYLYKYNKENHSNQLSNKDFINEKAKDTEFSKNHMNEFIKFLVERDNMAEERQRNTPAVKEDTPPKDSDKSPIEENLDKRKTEEPKQEEESVNRTDKNQPAIEDSSVLDEFLKRLEEDEKKPNA